MPPVGMSPQNASAIKAWQILDLFGRGIDGFSGVPLPLRLESIDLECGKHPDPDGIRWRVLLIEEKVYAKRIDRFKAEQDKSK